MSYCPHISCLVSEPGKCDVVSLYILGQSSSHELAFKVELRLKVCSFMRLWHLLELSFLLSVQWMPLVEFVEQPLIQEDDMFKKIIDIFIARLGKRYCGLSVHQLVSKFDDKLSTLYFNTVDDPNLNCQAS